MVTNPPEEGSEAGVIDAMVGSVYSAKESAGEDSTVGWSATLTVTPRDPRIVDDDVDARSVEGVERGGDVHDTAKGDTQVAAALVRTGAPASALLGNIVLENRHMYLASGLNPSPATVTLVPPDWGPRIGETEVAEK